MSCEIPITLANGVSVRLDSGIVEIIEKLNKKGYYTTFCCEGHKKWCEGYKHPTKRMEYGQYSPLFIDFKQGCEPLYFPNIYPYEAMGKHARQEFKNNRFIIYFELYKRKRGNVDREHDRVLKLMLAWAKGLPVKFY